MTESAQALTQRVVSRELVLGGQRSGKSRRAEQLAISWVAKGEAHGATFIATATAHNDDMAERIARHRARRDDRWRDIEAPLDLVAALDDSDGTGARLVDCLTLWLTNLMFAPARDWRAEAEALVAALPRQQSPVILVTNEVGMGIVPDNALAREFRDAAGTLNQRIAAVADEVILAVSGLSLKVK